MQNPFEKKKQQSNSKYVTRKEHELLCGKVNRMEGEVIVILAIVLIILGKILGAPI
jgi:hypothetical protein